MYLDRDIDIDKNIKLRKITTEQSNDSHSCWKVISSKPEKY